ncbi:OsmC family protein [Aquimarina sp. 2201CG1-2-11]|uniref:OsmC family protein n=1 Tax=Aquimarina discodermiae TaxID=3231043 RepID=UPI0034618E69
MAAEIKVKNLPSGYQSIITNGKHTIIGDEPIKNKGTDLGLAPAELILGGLAMCKAATIRCVARIKGWDIRDINVELKQEIERGKNRVIYNHIKINIEIEGDITSIQRKELLKQTDKCYVHKMLEGDWDIAPSKDLTKMIR